MTPETLIKIQHDAVRAFKIARDTPIVDDDFPENLEKADLAIARADHAYKEYQKEKKS